LDPDEMPSLLEHLSFKSMKDNPAVNKDDLVKVILLVYAKLFMKNNQKKSTGSGKTTEQRVK